MDEQELLPGSLGTSASLSLRVGQTIFSSASLLFMSLGVEFYSYTAFCFLVTIMGLVIPWSLTLALVDGYSVLAGFPLRQPGILLIVVIGDWVLSILSLAAACASAAVINFLLNIDGLHCVTKFCCRYQLSIGMAFLSWFLSAASSLINSWLLPCSTIMQFYYYAFKWIKFLWVEGAYIHCYHPFKHSKKKTNIKDETVDWDLRPIEDIFIFHFLASTTLCWEAMKYMEKEITHFSHPQHKLRFEYTEAPFKCDGCKEVGIGSRYKCSFCDFDLHKHCALPSPFVSHIFYPKCSFQFLPRPPGDLPRFCNACEKDINGFVYHCKSCGFDLHPTCANLPRVLEDGEVKLHLYCKASEPCHKCGRKGRSWTYRSTCKKYNLHVACVREMLVESWHDIYLGRGSNGKKLETRIPSLKGTLVQNHQRGKGKVRKCSEIAGLAVQFIISAILGDPTAIIAGVVGSLISKS